MCPFDPDTPCSRRVAQLLTVALLAAAPGLARKMPLLAGSPATSLPTVEAVTSGDFDGDGDLDVAAAASSVDEVVWLEDTGTGFTSHRVTNALDEPVDVESGDIDCDGDLDLVIAAHGTGSVAWYRNDGGTGSWPLGATITTAAADVASIALADFNGDGDLDVVGALQAGGEVVRWRNQGCPGTVWNAATVANGLGGPVAVTTGDVDGDGDPDVVAALFDQDDVVYFRNTGGGAWATVTIDISFNGATAVSVGDIDGDGDLDVAGAGNLEHEVAWWRNPGASGTWDYRPLGVVPLALEAQLVDVDRDGDLDLLTASDLQPQPVYLWDNPGGGASGWTVQVVESEGDSPRDLIALDRGPDGDVDVVLGHGPGVRYYENSSSHRSGLLGDAGSSGQLATFREAVDWATGDLDGDGLVDLVVVERDLAVPDARVYWMRNLGVDEDGRLELAPHVEIEGTTIHGYESVALGDLDADGDLDVFIGETNHVGFGGTYCRNGGGAVAWSCGPQVTGYWNVDGVAAGDIDGDGDLDVAAAGEPTAGDTPDAIWWELSANGSTWTSHTIQTAVTGLSGLRPVDLEGDGDVDLMSNTNTWWRNNGGSPIAWVAKTIPGSTIGEAAFGDVDGDGDVDVAGSLFTTSGPTLGWFENDLAGPTNSWIEHALRGVLFANTFDDVALADFDVDGDLDFVAGINVAEDRRFAWFENDPGTIGGTWPEHAIPLPFGLTLQGSELFTDDLDHDGDADLLAGRRDEDFSLDFGSWLNGGGQFALAATGIAPSTIADGSERAVLRVDALHRGRPGEAAMELVNLSLLFEATPGDPLTELELQGAVEAVRVYRDDGSGTFDAALDALAATFTILEPMAGVIRLPLPDGPAALQQLPASAPATYFLTLELKPAASSGATTTVTVTHLQTRATADNADFDMPLSREPGGDTETVFQIIASAFGEGFDDGFEGGDLDAWSGSQPWVP